MRKIDAAIALVTLALTACGGEKTASPYSTAAPTQIGSAVPITVAPASTSPASLLLPTETLSPTLSVSADGRRLSASGSDFYWLADTGWDLLYELTQTEVNEYLSVRKQQGFNTIMFQFLSGYRPRTNKQGRSPTNAADQLDPQFVETAKATVRAINQQGLVPVMLVTWGTNVTDRHFTEQTGYQFGKDVGAAFGDQNIVWMLGGDVNATPATIPIWAAIANGLKDGSPRKHLISYHPTDGSSSQWFNDASWLDFNSIQSGHSRYRPQTKTISGLVRKDYALSLVKPTSDLESGYEEIPDGLARLHPTDQPVKPEDRIDAFDLRVREYQTYLAGAFGYTYGDLNVMNFWRPGNKERWAPQRDWRVALRSPGAEQLRIFQSVRMEMGTSGLVPNDDIAPPLRNQDYTKTLAACSSVSGACLIYTADGRPVAISTTIMAKYALLGTWINPRTGERLPATAVVQNSRVTFSPPGTPTVTALDVEQRRENDWLLKITQKTV